MLYSRLEKVNNLLLDMQKDIVNSGYTRSDISDCILAGIPEIIQLVKELDNGYNNSTYQKAYAIVNSFISLVDGTRFLNDFKVIRHYLEMYNILY